MIFTKRLLKDGFFIFLWIASGCRPRNDERVERLYFLQRFALRADFISDSCFLIRLKLEIRL